MKKLLMILGLVALCASVKAQNVLFVNASSNGPSLSVTNGLIDCRKQKTIGVQINQATSSAGGLAAGTMLYYFYRTSDGVTLDSAPQIVGSPVQTGLANVFSTNLDSFGMGYFKFVSTNAVATTGVVVTVNYTLKPGSAQ